LNSRIFALLALAILICGCVPVTTSPSGTGQSPPISPQTMATTDLETDSGNSSVPDDIAVGVLDEAGADIAMIVLQEDDSRGGPELNQVAPVQPEPVAEADVLARARREAERQSIISICNEIGNKLGSVSVEDCLAQSLEFGGAYTVQDRPIAIRDFQPGTRVQKPSRILIMGGIHGDEYSSISIMFKWMELLERSDNKDFRWRFVPTVNPDGLLVGQAVRQNANAVDLNRNFSSRDWVDLAEDYWENITHRNPRRFPGEEPASEPEVQWVVNQIQSYKPDVIVSVHAPYHLLDYDGPPEPPEQIGELHLHLLGVYTGSLGNYAGINLGIPVVTMELPSAGIMPSDEQIISMWNDLLEWLYEHHSS